MEKRGTSWDSSMETENWTRLLVGLASVKVFTSFCCTAQNSKSMPCKGMLSHTLLRVKDWDIFKL